MCTPLEYAYFLYAVVHTHLTLMLIYSTYQSVIANLTVKLSRNQTIYLSSYFARYTTRPRNCRVTRYAFDFMYYNFWNDASIFRKVIKFDLDFTYSTGYTDHCEHTLDLFPRKLLLETPPPPPNIKLNQNAVCSRLSGVMVGRGLHG
jgi:hypothetical protein